jgi:catechol 2,3-dioxygenase-like lactoylglutathione lyase family enzyme
MPDAKAAAGLSLAELHHVGIQTNDLENSLSWYQDFLGFRVAWTMSEFSELTNSRLPGIKRLAEIEAGALRLHLIERAGSPASRPGESITQFQHVCMAVRLPDELTALRDRWIDLYKSGGYIFALADQPTEVVTDDEGIQSFYAYDVNGLELEFTYVPE